MKKALIFGVTGQDGAYLTEFLLGKGYEVHGVKRRSSSFNTQRVDHLFVDRHKKTKFYLHYGDLADSSGLVKIISDVQPDEIYNLGAMSHVRLSFDIPEYSTDINATGTIRVLEAIRINGLEKKTRFYQASTSELYGKVQEVPQTEETPFYPRSPYAAAKTYSYWITKNYREAYGLFACNGILFNHESPYRGETFVTRKITRAAVQIKYGFQEVLYLGNLDAKRDWGYAKEYVEGMWKMLQADKPDDYVLATGKTTKVRTFVEYAFKALDIEIEWQGESGTIDETGIDKKTGKTLVKIDPQYFRPTEVDLLIGDPSKAKRELNWEATTTVEELVKIMIDADVELLQRPSTLSVLESAKQLSQTWAQDSLR